MSLDFDRSPDGEPLPPADKVPVPAHQAPATTEGTAEPAPSFTPAANSAEPADDELADEEPVDDERAADEPEPAELADDEPVTSGSASAYEPADDELADDEPADDELADDELADDELGPATTEPAAAEPTVAEPTVTETVPADATASEVTAYHTSTAPAWDAQSAGAGESADRPAATEPAAGLAGPLLGDADEQRASWQRIQAAFVDDPREAVADAAGLVEQMEQEVADALRQLRATWDRDGQTGGVQYADSGGSAAGDVSPGEDRAAEDDGPGTEQLRLLIRRYRVMFDHLCQS